MVSMCGSHIGSLSLDGPDALHSYVALSTELIDSLGRCLTTITQTLTLEKIRNLTKSEVERILSELLVHTAS